MATIGQVAHPPVLPCLQSDEYVRAQNGDGSDRRRYHRPRSDPKMVYDVSFCEDAEIVR